MNDPKDIYQDHLDRISRALWDGDFDTVCANMHLPKRIETADRVAVMETVEDMQASLVSFRDSMLRLGATAYHRVCRSVTRDADPDLLHGIHRTYIMRGGQYVLDPYDVAMELRRVDGRWLGSTIRSHLRNATCTVISPHIPSLTTAAKGR